MEPLTSALHLVGKIYAMILAMHHQAAGYRETNCIALFALVVLVAIISCILLLLINRAKLVLPGLMR